MLPLFLISLIIWYLFILLYPEMKKLLKDLKFELKLFHSNDENLSFTLENWLNNNNTSASKITKYSLYGLDYSLFKKRFEEAVKTQLHIFKHNIFIIKVLIGAAPLLGLLGTVKGMIETFSTFSQKGGVSINLLSAGISEALLTTQTGLFVALSGIIAIYFLKKLFRNLELEFSFLLTRLTFLIKSGNL